MRFTTYLGSRAISRGEEKSKRKLIFQESWDRLFLFTSSRTTLGFWEVGPRVPRIKLVQLFKHYGANKLQMKDQWVGLLGFDPNKLDSASSQGIACCCSSIRLRIWPCQTTFENIQRCIRWWLMRQMRAWKPLSHMYIDTYALQINNNVVISMCVLSRKYIICIGLFGVEGWRSGESTCENC